MARNFYKDGDKWYYADNGQQILNVPELTKAHKDGGKEVAKVAPTPQTQAELEQLYTDAAPKNPAIAKVIEGGSSVEEIINALSTGNLSGIVDWQGQPFSAQDQQDALTNAGLANKDYYNALQEKDKADAEAKLANDQANYQDYLINAGQSFEADKSSSDQKAADSGVLFSGSRVQKEKNLERAYTQDQATKLRQVTGNINSAANDFQYKYGSDAASGLNKYYNLGGNTFNAGVASGGVGSTGLSSVYSPSKYSYQGTVNTERKADTATRAAGYLWNKGNKLLATGYQNQYK